MDHGCLRLAGYAGIGAAEAAAWQWILPGAPGPFRAVLAKGTPVCSRRDRPPPGEILPGPSAQAARALLPLFRRGKQVGRALVGWPGPTALDGTLRRALAGLLDVGGAALDTADAVRPAVSAPVLVDVLDSLAHPAALLRFTAPPGRRPSTI
ncbi:hypothetical protein ACFC0N_32100 [Streptomyces zaomyceticus]|uniref:hypothetical protein n=1 Tax=Streptomyces zaomyceticus TaxID=68286 RepID=UPI0035D8E480